MPDWEVDAGAESVCYANEGPLFVATRWGIQGCADDGPTQVILPLPDCSRVFGVRAGGESWICYSRFAATESGNAKRRCMESARSVCRRQ